MFTRMPCFAYCTAVRPPHVVDQDIDTAEGLAASFHHGAHLGIVGDVADMRGDLAVIANERDRFGHCLRVLIDGKNLGAFAREQDRGGAPIAPARPHAARTADQRDLSRHTPSHKNLPVSPNRAVRIECQFEAAVNC